MVALPRFLTATERTLMLPPNAYAQTRAESISGRALYLCPVGCSVLLGLTFLDSLLYRALKSVEQFVNINFNTVFDPLRDCGQWKHERAGL